MKHPVSWHSPSPLWSRILDAPREAPVAFRQPALLRFAGDGFMEDLGRLLADDAGQLADHVARPETWRAPAAGWGAPSAAPLKLYQAVHGRYYLVAASLVCRLPGLPERKVDAAAEERVSFVVRRLAPLTAGGAVNPADPATWRELGWVGGRSAGIWAALPSPAEAHPTEERLPLFSLTFADGGLERRLHAGLIPVASVETYAAGALAAAPAAGGEPLADPRVAELLAGVLPGLEQLAEIGDAVAPHEARDVLAFALVDLAAFLRRRHEALWGAVESSSAADLDSGALAVYQRLGQTLAGQTWRALLVWATAHESAILSGTAGGGLLPGAPSRDAVRQGAAALLGSPPSTLEDLFRAAFVALPPPAGSAPPPVTPAADGSYYTVRCVYQRPRCGAAVPPLVSPPSAAFRLAAFFDPDAPARPLRISMPVDTSPKGLRRFPKGVSVLLSNQLRRQLQRAASATIGDLEEGDAGSDPGLPSLGMICSLSIPIISICALILLMIVVNLLNIVFWWKPLFKICFPLKLGA